MNSRNMNKKSPKKEKRKKKIKSYKNAMRIIKWTQSCAAMSTCWTLFMAKLAAIGSLIGSIIGSIVGIISGVLTTIITCLKTQIIKLLKLLLQGLKCLFRLLLGLFNIALPLHCAASAAIILSGTQGAFTALLCCFLSLPFIFSFFVLIFKPIFVKGTFNLGNAVIKCMFCAILGYVFWKYRQFDDYKNVARVCWDWLLEILKIIWEWIVWVFTRFWDLISPYLMQNVDFTGSVDNITLYS